MFQKFLMVQAKFDPRQLFFAREMSWPFFPFIIFLVCEFQNVALKL